ncbi:MAG: hypothetical protein FJ279_18855 [Planctomycetes bacterium]|nr:hypothetical protein [Planctomycetota bacterium]
MLCRSLATSGLFVLILSLVHLAADLHAAPITNDDCLACHDDKELVKKDASGKTVSMFIDKAKYEASIHHKNLCTSCHTDIKEIPHAERLKPVSCSQCHRIETDIHLKSDHGQALHKGVHEAATCGDCHGNPHELLNYRNPDSPVHRTHIPKTCARCHGHTEEMEKFHLRQHAPIVSYEKSVHGVALGEKHMATSAVCTDCHGSHDLHKATNPASKLFWQNIPATCGKCHENVRQTFLRSVHGKAVQAGKRDAPVCTDCHGEHNIMAVNLATSKVFQTHVPETCGQCHSAERIIGRYRLPSKVVESYMQSYHGLALQFGAPTVANCASCHGAHDILPAADPLSSVNKANLPQTCGKCHPAIGTRLAASPIRIHAQSDVPADHHWIVVWVTRFYIVIIILTIGGMFAHHALDYFKKLRAHIRLARAADAEARMSRLVRAQHFTLIALFITLVYTGFVHKFPDAFFSWPFHVLPDGNAIRGLIHRISGWLFVGFFIAHVAGVVLTRRGRAHLWDLFPRPSDLTDMLATVAYNLGLRSAPPSHVRYNYVEKSEYWALLWGSVVMIVTGVMLVATETVLRLLPKVWHDVAQVVHYYEALLATLAIAVWHLYAVVFDPEQYPMNTTWLIGKRLPPRHIGAAAPSANGQSEPAEQPQTPSAVNQAQRHPEVL